MAFDLSYAERTLFELATTLRRAPFNEATKSHHLKLLSLKRDLARAATSATGGVDGSAWLRDVEGLQRSIAALQKADEQRAGSAPP